MLAVYLQYTRRQQKTQYQQPECDTKGREKWPFPGRTVTILHYQRSADGLRARSSCPRSRAGVLAAQRAASVGAGLDNRATAQRPALDGGQGGGTIPGDGPTPAPTARPSQVFSSPPPCIQSRGAAWGGRSPRPQARPLLRHTGAGRAWLSRPQAASRDRAFWAGLRRGRAYGQSRIAARAAAKLRPCADALAAAWAGWEAG